jgi:hypothetical protein
MSFKQIHSILLLAAVIFLSAVSPVYGQDLEPRAYSNIPVGLNFIAAGYAYTAGGILFDPSVPLENANIRIHGTVLHLSPNWEFPRHLARCSLNFQRGYLSSPLTISFMVAKPVPRPLSKPFRPMRFTVLRVVPGWLWMATSIGADAQPWMVLPEMICRRTHDSA